MSDIKDFIRLSENHSINYQDDIYTITSGDWNQKLFVFLKRFNEIQIAEKHYQLPFNLYEQFPHVDIAELASETFTRKQDLQILKNHFRDFLNSNNTALEIGGWNGWLTNYLSGTGLSVVTTDIFDDEQNGLKSKKHYKRHNWLSIQTDLLDTSIYNSKFDIIVFNHCLQFLTNPIKLIEKYKLLLNKNGVILILGNTFYKKTSIKESQVHATKQYFKKQYDFEIQFYDCKSYFSYEDLNNFSKNGLKLISYKFSLLGRLKKFLKKEKSGILYFINSKN